MPTPEPPLARLELDGLVRRDGDRVRTTRRWQGAMARAAFALEAEGAPFDLRLPVVRALVELYGDELTDDDVVRLAEAILPIEAAELSPAPRAKRASVPAP